MRICILGNAAYPLLQRRAEALAQHGHDVHVISLESGEIEQCSIHRVYSSAVLRKFKGHFAGALPKVRRLVQAIEPDVLDIHGASSWGVYVLLPSIAPCVVTVYGPDIYSHAASSLLLRRMVRMALQRADLVLGSTSVIGSYVRKHVGIDLKDKLRTHSFGIALSEIRSNAEARRRSIREEFGVNESTRVLLHSRHIAELWRVDTIIEAMPAVLAQNSDIELWFAYPEPNDQGKRLLEKIQARSAVLGFDSKIRWLGFNPYERMISIMHAADVYICVGKADLKASSIDEAVSTGLIPVLSNMPAYADVVHDGHNGFLLSEVNPDTLGSKINMVLSRFPQLHSQVSAYSEEHVLSVLDIPQATRWTVLQYEEAVKGWKARKSVRTYVGGS